MRKTIKFQESKNDTALLARKPPAYEDLVLTDEYRKYRHRFEAGKTTIRFLPAFNNGTSWLLEVPTLQHANGRHAHPSVRSADARSVYDLALHHLKAKHPDRLFGPANKSGIRLEPLPVSVCWVIVQDSHGTRLRLLVASLYQSKHRGGTHGLGRIIHEFVSRYGRDHTQPGHPLNPADGVSIVLERVSGADTRFSSFRLSLADDRGPLQPILDKISDMEHNALIPVEDTIRILDPEEEWRLLAEVIGDDLVAEVRAAQVPEVAREEAVKIPEILPSPQPEEPIDEIAYHPDDYKDFPPSWGM